MTVKEVSRKTGVSIRALHHYDSIGLLKPSSVTEAGYRLYDDTALEKLQQILLFRELEFPLKEIERIINSENFDREKALAQQIKLLTMKKEHLEDLIDFATKIKEKGERNMSFKAFDTTKIEEYTKKAKEQWGDTAAYQEFEKKNENRTKEEQQSLNEALMDIFRGFGEIKEEKPDGKNAQALVKKLQDFLTKNYYNCTKEILAGLGIMYGSGGEFTENINKESGAGTAEFASRAIEEFCNGEKIVS